MTRNLPIVKYGNTERRSFGRIREVQEIPYLIEVQKDSYENFIRKGIDEVLSDFSPICDFSEQHFELRFLGHSLGEKPKYDEKECRERDATYAVPLKVKVRLINKDKGGEVIDQEVHMGDFPLMTENGSFIINGAERVIVSQLVRSPGVYNGKQIDKAGRNIYDTTVIPNRGAWLEFEQDSQGILWVHVDRTRKITASVLLRALGFGSDAELLNLFAGDAMMWNTVCKDAGASVAFGRRELYKRVRPGEMPSEDAQRKQINGIFYDAKRYDLSRVGRHKYDLKLCLATRIEGQTLAEDAVTAAGEVIAKAGETLSLATAKSIQNAGINSVTVKVAGSPSFGLDLRLYAAYMAGALVTEDGEVLTPKTVKAMCKENADRSVRVTVANAAYPLNLSKCNKNFLLEEGKEVEDLGENGVRLLAVPVACVKEDRKTVFEAGRMVTTDLAKKLTDPLADVYVGNEETGKAVLVEDKENVIISVVDASGVAPVSEISLRLLNAIASSEFVLADECAIARGADKEKEGVSSKALALAGDDFTEAVAAELLACGFHYVRIAPKAEIEGLCATHKIIGNNTVNFNDVTGLNCKDYDGMTEYVYYPAYVEMLQGKTAEEIDALLRLRKDGTIIAADDDIDVIKQRIAKLCPKCITLDDIVATVSNNLDLNREIGMVDNIDHLGNRRVRSVGELLQNQFRIGMARLERVIKERMMTQDSENVTPQSLTNVRPVSSAIKEFFGSSQLSQFMDQTNPIAELTHKRKLSALGPGGLNRDRATFDVRDIHHTHYGRICPIETPEGQNIGLITSLSAFAKVNDYGFIEAAYRKVDKANCRVTDEVIYMTADEEDKYTISEANEPLDENGCFINDRVACRRQDVISEMPKTEIDFMDVSPKQLISVATALIPFLENDDTNRALMGSNMQRQAVPLLTTQTADVATGIEAKIARDSGVMILAKEAGVVTYMDGAEIRVKEEDGFERTYSLKKFQRSNQGTCVNQRPIVKSGDIVKKGDILADGPATKDGELALGKNILIGFMTWEGYNYEDAILLSEKLVREDVFTSIHIEEHETEARDTKLGSEEITRDIPNVGDAPLAGGIL
ncbi:MAG: DNA-directed RNA polymerase subunit beta [Clostridia bacterium]|nr:DNA-directed RNA polymerase subunit beta [Clostridia bacterium]